MNNLELMQARTNVLFTYDGRGRMLYDNDPERRPAPRIYLAYTADGYVLRFGQAISDVTAAQIGEIVHRQPPVEDVRTTPRVVEAVQEALSGQSPAPQGGPAYRFPEPLPSPGGTVQITEATVQLALHTYPWLLAELAEWWPCFAVVRDGAAVSICFSARIGAAVCEAGVETVPAFRRHGYAATVTAAWVSAILHSGRIPVYSTSWGNVASQGVAQHLGLILFGADAVWT